MTPPLSSLSARSLRSSSVVLLVLALALLGAPLSAAQRADRLEVLETLEEHLVLHSAERLLRSELESLLEQMATGSSLEPDAIEVEELGGGLVALSSARHADGPAASELRARLDSGTGPSSSIAPSGQQAPLRTVLEGLRQDARIDWAFAALRHRETGAIAYPTPDIVISTGLGREALAAVLPQTVSLTRALRGARDQWVVTLRDPKASDPLAVAAALSVLPGTDWAEVSLVQAWRRDRVESAGAAGQERSGRTLVARGSADPNDPLFGEQWHLLDGSALRADARLEGAWERTTGTASTVIAVLDDGVQSSHPDLMGRMFVNDAEIPSNGVDDDNNGYVDDTAGWDFYDGDNLPDPTPVLPSHGTAVAGIAAAHGHNALGITGACQDCSILPVRIAAASFVGDAEIAEAIRYAGQFADVLNNSWGGGVPSAAISTAIAEVTANGRGGKGSPVLFSTGNSATGYIGFTLTGFPAGTFTLHWTYAKNASGSAGFDSAWLDDVVFPDGTLETFTSCSGLPSGWTTSGDGLWSVESDDTRAFAALGGGCSLRSGAIGDGQSTTLSITRTFATSGDLRYGAWSSSESSTGEGPIQIDNGDSSPECLDGLRLTVVDASGTTFGPFFFQCGTWSSQNRPLLDGVVSFPAVDANTIAIGAATDLDLRASYSQWGPELDVVAHSGGARREIWTTDMAGPAGYSDGDGNPDTGGFPDTSNHPDYTAIFSGTSAAAPLASGVVGLLLSEAPQLSAVEVRHLLRQTARPIGRRSYPEGRNDVYGHGAVAAADLLRAASGYLFDDGFESADETAWSSAQGN